MPASNGSLGQPASPRQPRRWRPAARRFSKEPPASRRTAATAADSGKEVFTGTIARTASAATMAASGKEVFQGPVALTQSAHTGTSAGVEHFTATVALTQSVHTGSGIGAVTGLITEPDPQPWMGGMGGGSSSRRAYVKPRLVPFLAEFRLVQSTQTMTALGTVTPPKPVDMRRVRIKQKPPKITGSVKLKQSGQRVHARAEMNTRQLDQELELLGVLLLLED